MFGLAGPLEFYRYILFFKINQITNTLHNSQSNLKKKEKKEGWVNRKGKKGREGETPALKNPIFVDNMLQSGLQDFQST